MDPNNPVVKLCAEGMALEQKGQREEAALLFQAAWKQSTDDFERCISAHYVARQQKTPEENLRWNQISLDHADAILDGRVDTFYPSLYLNIGWAYEDLGQPEEARKYYELAAERVSCLPEGSYRDTVQDGIQRGLRRVNAEDSR
jgi:tetratricopeptide (TPR) repeat protein